MKSLIIDKKFTKEYMDQLNGFLSSMQPYVASINCYENSVANAIHQLKDNVTLIIKQLRTNKPVTRTLSIEPNITLEIQNIAAKNGQKFYICIGGIIEIENSILVNQSISLIVLYEIPDALSEQDAKSWNCHTYAAGTHVLRKFHFDIDKGIKGNWPISHLQYGGSDNSSYINFKNEIQYQLYSPFDTPRIPHPPYSLVICLDVILRCFHTDASKITKESFWVDKVKESEEKWLAPFYENVLNHLKATGRKTTLWDFYSTHA